MELRLKVPKELEEDIKDLPKIEVSLVLTKLLEEAFEKLARLKRIVAKSKFTENDVKELSGKVDRALAKRFAQSLKA